MQGKRFVNDPKAPRVLVVFFSRTGTTRRIAQAIAHATGGDCEELQEERSRKGILGWLRSGYEGTYRRSTEPLPLQHQLAAYDIVYVGSPTWNRSLSSPVRGFLTTNRAALAKVSLFATCAGGGADEVIAQMSSLLAAPPLASMALLDREIGHGAAVEIGELVERTLQAWSGSAACCADVQAPGRVSG